MRASILAYGIILTKVHRAVVRMMAKGCIVACIVLSLKCFFFLLPNYIHVYAIIMQ